MKIWSFLRVLYRRKVFFWILAIFIILPSMITQFGYQDLVDDYEALLDKEDNEISISWIQSDYEEKSFWFKLSPSFERAGIPSWTVYGSIFLLAILLQGCYLRFDNKPLGDDLKVRFMVLALIYCIGCMAILLMSLSRSRLFILFEMSHLKYALMAGLVFWGPLLFLGSFLIACALDDIGTLRRTRMIKLKKDQRMT